MKLSLKILSILFCLFVALEGFAEKFFQGEIVYSCKASGSNEDGVKIFENFAPSQITINWNKSLFRLQEKGGLNQADVIADLKSKQYYFLQHKQEQAIKASLTNLDDTPEEVRAILPHHFKTELQPTEKEEIILGKKCKHYQILRSAFMKPDSVGTLCINQELQLPLSRYDFSTSNMRTIVPVPMNFINDIGSVMKVDIVENNVKVICEITALEAKPKSKEFFAVPHNYTIVEKMH